MKLNLLLILAWLLSPGALAQSLPQEERVAFRQAVEDYQLFVTPHCAPDVVRAYVAARRERDEAFVRSLQNTELKVEYDQAIADQAVKDRHTVYECAGPPPPPGSAPPDPAELQLSRHKSLITHFHEGDRQFARMVQLRDAFIASAKR